MEALFFDDILSAIRNNIIYNNLNLYSVFVYKYSFFQTTFPVDGDLQDKPIKECRRSCRLRKTDKLRFRAVTMQLFWET